MKVLEPIPTEGLTTEDATRLSIEAHDLMQCEYDKLNKAMLNDALDSNNNSTPLKSE